MSNTHRVFSLLETFDHDHRVELPRYWINRQDEIGQSNPARLRETLLTEVKADVLAFSQHVINPSASSCKQYINQQCGYTLLDKKLIILVESLIDSFFAEKPKRK